VNTRASHQAAALDSLLLECGAIPLSYPCIAIVPPADTSMLDAALRDLIAGTYDWLLLTSANTVFAITQRLSMLNLSLLGANFRTAAIGSSTADAARESLHVEQIELPEEYVAESLAESLPITAGERVLLPESAIARPTLANLLTGRGAAVTVCKAYNTVTGTGGVDLPVLLDQIDALTFTSSSTVTGFMERIGDVLPDALDICAVCIGTKTAATASEYDFRQIITADPYTLAGIVQALETYFSGEKSNSVALRHTNRMQIRQEGNTQG
jgi:uroporphyrinogen-III synthase